MINKFDKVLYFDIETSPILAAVWGLGKQYVGVDNIIKERKLLTISYMWEGTKKPIVLKLNLKKHDINKFDDDADKEMLMKFMDEVQQANLLVAHNGRRFDLARIRARLVKYDLPDLPPILFDDSYTFTKDIDFTSHKLTYLSKVLNLENKLKTNFDLWIQIFVYKNKKALNYMAKYNSQDVILLSKVYKKLRKYGKSKLNLAISREDAAICPKCGSKTSKDGYVVRGLGKYQQYECNSKMCRYKFRDGINILKSIKDYPR